MGGGHNTFCIRFCTVEQGSTTQWAPMLNQAVQTMTALMALTFAKPRASWLEVSVRPGSGCRSHGQVAAATSCHWPKSLHTASVLRVFYSTELSETPKSDCIFGDLLSALCVCKASIFSRRLSPPPALTATAHSVRTSCHGLWMRI